MAVALPWTSSISPFSSSSSFSLGATVEEVTLNFGLTIADVSSHATRNLLIMGGSAGAGAVIGGAAGGGKGAAIGAAAGARACPRGAYLTRKSEILLPPEKLLTLHLSSVQITPQEL